MADELIKIVDKKNRKIGSATKQQAWSQGLIHQIARVVIEDKNGRILLQKRAPNKIPFPDCWGNACSGHVDADETYQQTVRRELEEELGIEGADLKELGSFYLEANWRDCQLNRFNKVYKILVTETPKKLQTNEVAEVKWFTLAEVKQLIKDYPNKIDSGLQPIISRYY